MQFLFAFTYFYFYLSADMENECIDFLKYICIYFIKFPLFF